MTRLGDPVPRATIEVTEAFAPGSNRPARVTTTQTGDSGGYQPGLGKGPTRKVTLVFVGNATLGRTTSRTLTIRAYDRTVLKIRPNVIRNGGSVKMSGSVRVPEVSRGRAASWSRFSTTTRPEPNGDPPR